MDDLFNFGSSPREVKPTQSFPAELGVAQVSGSSSSSAVPFSLPTDSQPQHVSRRAAREAELLRAAPAESPTRREAKAQRPAGRGAEKRRSGKVPSPNQGRVSRVQRESSAPIPATHKLRRTDHALVQGTVAKASRKHPLSVLFTMSAVGGLFAVAGLPAYAVDTDTELKSSTVLASELTSELVPQSIVVSSDVAALTAERDGYQATTPAQLAARSRDQLRAQYNAAYLASGARALGDDYPWPYELRSWQGGGLSPLNYYYRECVDFVAWRINRDQGSYAEPFKWVWSNLTPNGGSASQWKSSWVAKGWPTSTTPVVGSVAWFGSANHVAYVKSVLEDGYVVLEEYNFFPGVYSQRTILASEVNLFLYPPS
jgi:surface antigen